MALSPSLIPAVVAAAVAGVGNGVEAVAARTALQESVEERWMALVMSFSESLNEAAPGIGIVLGRRDRHPDQQPRRPRRGAPVAR